MPGHRATDGVDHHLTRERLGRPAPVHASLSLDGSLLALTTTSIPVGTEALRTELSIVRVADGEASIVAGRDRELRVGVWSPTGDRLAVSTDDAEVATVAIVDLSDVSDPAAFVDPRVLAGASHAVGPAVWSPDGGTIAVPCRRGVVIDRTRPYRWTRPVAAFDGLGPLEDPPQLRLVDVDSGAGRWLTDDDWRWSMIRWSPAGDRLAAVVSVDPTGQRSGQSVRLVDLDGTVTVPDLPAGRTVIPAWLDDGRLLVLISEPRDRPSGGSGRLVVVNDDGIREVPVDHLLGDVYGDHPAELADSYDHVLLPLAGSSVVVRTGWRGRMGIVLVDVDLGTVDQLLTGDRCCSPVAVRDDVLVFTTQAADRPVELAVLTGLRSGTRVERRLTSSAPELPPSVEVRRFVVDAPDGDGQPLDAWFLSSARAIGAEPGVPLPTVLVIHGGPHFAFGESFNLDAHALCDAGFGVLYTDPRGSTGWGDAFAHAAHGDWADGPTRDVLAVVDRAIAEGWVDGARLGVTGNSYGGYLSAWLSATTDRFRAAVVENPVTDLVALWATSDIGPAFFVAQFGGPPHERPDVGIGQSPLFHAHRSTTPSLFVVGEIDRRCPSAHAWAMHRVLVSVGTPSEVLVLPGSSHEGSTYGPPVARFAHDDALVEWMTRWIGVG